MEVRKHSGKTRNEKGGGGGGGQKANTQSLVRSVKTMESVLTRIVYKCSFELYDQLKRLLFTSGNSYFCCLFNSY